MDKYYPEYEKRNYYNNFKFQNMKILIIFMFYLLFKMYYIHKGYQCKLPKMKKFSNCVTIQIRYKIYNCYIIVYKNQYFLNVVFYF